jgi:hypothetical protein
MGTAQSSSIFDFLDGPSIQPDLDVLNTMQLGGNGEQTSESLSLLFSTDFGNLGNLLTEYDALQSFHSGSLGM